MWNHKTPGIPDEEFFRTEDVPITKEEVRAIQIRGRSVRHVYQREILSMTLGAVVGP